MVHRETIRLNAPLLDARMGFVPPPPPAPMIDVEALTRAAYERGRIEGEQAVSEQLVRQRVEFSELQNGLLATLRNTFPQVAREAESAMIELAFAAAQRLVAGLPISMEMVEATVREAIAQAHEAAEIEVQLHEEDLGLLQRAQSPLLATESGAQKINFTVSPSITRGGCLVHTRFGTVDARRETKLANLRETLFP